MSTASTVPFRSLVAALLLTALALPAAAQNCTNALDRAERSYQAGDFDATIERLTACLDAGRFSAEERRQAHRLVGLSYIGKDREADAREAVAALLEVAPNYEPDPALDPPPFVRLVSEVRRARPRTSRPGAARVASTDAGFNASFRAHGMGYSDSDDDSFTGAGGDVTLGYAFSPAVSLYAQLSGSAGDGDGGASVALGGVGLGGRFHINGGRAKVVPFVGAAASFQSATFEFDGLGDVDYSGPGGEVEGGVLYFVSPALALDAGVSAAFTSLGTDARPDDISATTLRLGVGVSWRP
ncbi:MAG: outer membrane beta-barrel protein [Bacteroidota bacterium]